MILKHKIFLSIMVVLLLIAGYILYPLILPLFIDQRVNEAPLPQTHQVNSVYKEGTFTGFDGIHNGSGTVSLMINEDSYIVGFQPDFNVQNGPDLYVGLGKDGKYIEGSEISKLKGNIGSQNYEVQAKFDPTQYNEVWIWCKRFSTPFARAILR